MPTQQCPRCGSGVPEGKTECNICFAPLGQAAQAPAAPSRAPEPNPGIPGLPLSQPSTTAPSPLTAASPASEPAPGIPGLYVSPPAATPNYLTPGAQPSAGGGMGSGEVRVSLTGEVLEVPAPTPRGTGPGGYGPPAGARPGGPPAAPIPARGGARSTPAPARSGAPIPARRETAQAKSGSGGAVLAVVLVLLLAGGGAGGWWWYNNRTNPKDQALLVYKSLLKRDWKTVAHNVAWPSNDVSKDEDTFVKGADASYQQTTKLLPPAILQAVENMDVSVSDPTVSGSQADVPTAGKMTVGGITVTLKGTAHMIRQGGIWKLDETKADMNNAMSMQKPLSDLIGKPDMSALPGGGAGLPGMGR